mgnify:CR=1 FL=1
MTRKTKDFLESDDPKIVAERNQLFGIPESPDQYEITPELASVVSEESLAAFKAHAHSIGLPQKYVNDLIQFETEIWMKHAQNQEAANEQLKEAVVTELREAWKGDSYEHNSKQVHDLLVNELGLTPEDLAMPIGNSAKLIKGLFEKVVPLYGPDRIIEGNIQLDPTSVGQRIQQINVEMHDLDRGTPEYNKLMEEKRGLLAKQKS